jgi:hypothetical protein
LEVCSGNTEAPTGLSEVSMVVADGIIFIDVMENCEVVLRSLSLLEVRNMPLVFLTSLKPTALISLKDECLRVLLVKEVYCFILKIYFPTDRYNIEN